MPQFAPRANLLRVSKAKKNDVDRWKEARHLESVTAHTIEELFHRAASDRFALAASFLRSADALLSGSRNLRRSAVSRYYYAMYHAMRAAAFVFHGGDDFEEHRILPSKAPDDLPNNTLWANALKDARERRNAADYDPYPKADAAWQRDAQNLAVDVRRFLSEVRVYLRSKGCAV